MKIHPTAVVHPNSEIGDGVEVGPYSVIGPRAKVGSGTVILNNVTIEGKTRIGSNNLIHANAVLGSEPQDLRHRGEETSLIVGDDNRIREFVTVNTGTLRGGGRTVVGNGNLFMACAHVAHDCIVGDHVILGNNVLLAGHVRVESSAILNGAAACNHFTTIGFCCYVGGLSRIVHDVPPFTICEGHPSEIRGLNRVGMERNGFTEEQIGALKEAYKLLFKGNLTQAKAIEELESKGPVTPEVRRLITFLRETGRGSRGRAREALRND